MRFLKCFRKPLLALTDVGRPGIIRTVRKPKRNIPRVQALGDFDAVFGMLQSPPTDRAIRIPERSVLVFLILEEIRIDGSRGHPVAAPKTPAFFGAFFPFRAILTPRP